MHRLHAIVLMYSYASVLQPTANATPDAHEPADSPGGSTLRLDIPLQWQRVVVLQLWSFLVNNASGYAVRWGDLDWLNFASCGPTERVMWLYDIGTTAAPVPEPGAFA